MGSGDGGRELAPDDDPLSMTSGSWEKLELDHSGGPSVPVSQQKVDPTEMGGGRLIGDAFDGLSSTADLPMPDLDMDAVRASSPHHPAPFARTSAPDLPMPQGPSSAAPVERSFAPPREATPAPAEAPLAGRTPASDDLPAFEVAAVADYGPVPDGVVGTVPYAILVLTRRRALQKALGDLRRLHGAAETDAKESLVELGRALHAHKDAELLSPLASFMAAADETGRVAGQRTQEWEKSRQTADAQRSSLSAKIEQAEQAAGPYRDRETKLATQMNARDGELRRAKAKLQRAEIELRNLSGSPEADESRQRLLEAEREARRADVQKAQGHVDELAPQLAAARRELAVMLQAINDLETQRRAVDDARNRTERVHLSTAGEAEKLYHEAVSHVAEQALLRKLAEGVAPEVAKNARTMRATLDARSREIRLHEAALAAYDKRSFQKGLTILGVAGAIILAMLIFVIVR